MNTVLNRDNYLNNKINQNNKIVKNPSMKIWPFLEMRCTEDSGNPVLYSFQQPSDKSIRVAKSFLETTEESTHDNISKSDPECFHCAIGPTLGAAQFFGVLPLSGIISSSPQKLQFKLYSFRILYCAIIMVLLIFMTVTSILHMIKNLKPDKIGLNDEIAAATAGAIFYGNSLIGLGIFMWLSPRWISLQKEWRSMELYLGRLKKIELTIKHPLTSINCLTMCKPCRPKLRWKFRMITAVVMGIALVEHIISISDNIPEKDIAALNESATWKDYVRIYSIKSHGFVLSSFNYNIGLGIFLFIISNIATFTWNFTDAFIMLVSTGLAERYKYLNHVLLDSSEEKVATLDWHEFRKYFALLSSLVKKTDSNISPIILLSFINNLYFICLQLLNGFSFDDSGVIRSIYFYFSVIFLVNRTIGVILLTSRVNDQSKIALPVLYKCPGSNFTVETQRLQFQLASDDICLTGLKFFSITRKFMLAVAGAIATYEIVLLQFDVAIHK